MAFINEPILVLEAVGTIVAKVITILGFIWRWKRDPIEILVCDNRGYPRTDVWIEMGGCQYNPDEHGRVKVPGKYLGSTIMVFETSSGRLLLITKLEKVGDESTIRIILPASESQDQ